jgi:hypothetical protein
MLFIVLIVVSSILFQSLEQENNKQVTNTLSNFLQTNKVYESYMEYYDRLNGTNQIRNKSVNKDFYMRENTPHVLDILISIWIFGKIGWFIKRNVEKTL